MFQNLRASRETELLAQFPIKVVCCWIGNSEKVALASYAMPTDLKFQEAADPNGCTILKPKATAATSDQSQECPIHGCVDGCISGLSSAITEHIGYSKIPGFPEENEVVIVEDSAGEMYLVGRAGLEPATEGLCTGNRRGRTCSRGN